MNVQEGFFNDNLSIKLDGISESPLSHMFESKVIGKKVSIFCGGDMIGRMESNFSGSIFYMYKVNFDKVEAVPLGKIIYDSTITLH